MLKRQKQGFYVPGSTLGMYQEGGEMVTSSMMMEDESQMNQDPMVQLMDMATMAVQEMNGELALQVCQMLVEMNTPQEEIVEDDSIDEDETQMMM